VTLRFIDGFDHYATADLAASLKWTYTGVVANCKIQSSAGRRGTGAFYTINGNQYLTKTLDNQATWIVGFALYIESFNYEAIICRLIDGTSTQISIAVDTTGHIKAYRGTTTALLGTSTNTLLTYTWNYIEFKGTIDPSNGVVEVRVNGSSVGWINLTSQNTRETANSYASLIRIGNVGSVSYQLKYYDDLYICDNQGSANNDFLGDSRIDAYWDDANGNSSQLVGSDADSIDNYLQTDDTTPDNDTSYNQSATVGEKDTYGHTDMTHTPLTIFGTQNVMVAKKDDEGSRSICDVCRSGGSDYDGSSQALTTSYIGYAQIREVDPATSAAWTKSGFNSAEFGMKIAA